MYISLPSISSTDSVHEFFGLIMLNILNDTAFCDGITDGLFRNLG
jgi:hypothetical protein